MTTDRSENKTLTYDFEVQSLVGIDAPKGTPWEDLIPAAKALFIHRIRNDEIELVCDTCFCDEDGSYDESPTKQQP